MDEMIPIAEPFLTEREERYVLDAVRSGWVSSQGVYLDRLVAELERTIGARMLPVNNGTAALLLPLLAFDLAPGDEIIVPDYTFAATINAVILAGGTPVVVDVDARGLLRAETARQALTERTVGIIPVHLFGEVAAMDEIVQLASERGLFVIEDCAEAIGASYRGRSAGAWGDAAAFSFYGNKIVTTGEGGAVACSNEDFFERMKLIMNHGMRPDRRYWHTTVGLNLRMTNMQAALGVAQMERFDEIEQAREKLFSYYRRNITNPRLRAFATEVVTAEYRPARWLYNVIVDRDESRDICIQHLRDNGIDGRATFYPLHQMQIYKPYCGSHQDYPNATRLFETLISLPSSPRLSLEARAHVVATLNKFGEHG